MFQNIRENPVLVATAVRSSILCGVAFGLTWTAEQVASVMLAVEAILALLTRQATVSNARVDQKVQELVAHREMVGTTGTGDGLTPPKR